MDQQLTEEQQRSAHKIIKANRGDCAKGSNYLNCHDCPKGDDESSECCANFPGDLRSPEFQAENLRRSQAWLDAHITDAEIMAETPTEFCERMVRTEGNGRCFTMIKVNHSLCKTCVISINGNGCSPLECLERSKAYLASHTATPQEPPKRRPTPDEMVVGATVRVRLWDELVKDGALSDRGHIKFPTIYFNNEMRQYCGNAYKVIKRFNNPLRVYLEICGADFGQWKFTPEMLDYVEPEKVVNPKDSAVNFFDWFGKKVTFKDGRNNGAKYTVCETYRDLDFDGAIHFKTVFFFKLLEIKGASFPAQLFNLCETQNAAKPEPVANAPKPDALRIIALEGQVDDLTKKLDESKKLCERLQRRLRANWEAKRDEEMATAEEIDAWWNAGKGSAIQRDGKSTICPKGCTDWIPATRGNLKL